MYEKIDSTKGSARYVFVTGGVTSSLGKGIAVASLGNLLESRGFKVAILKMDPYINVDPGTMSPFQHGEVYVTKDGAETDLDLGYYNRYTNSKLEKINSVSTGQIYQTVIERERRGDYLGRTVQVIPHITNEIKNRILQVGNHQGIDFVITEIGGTVGDIESIPFLEAIRQFRLDIGKQRVVYVHLTLVPSLAAAGELKTKPTQHSVKELLKLGIQPHILVCRTTKELPNELRKKISLFCNVSEEDVIASTDVQTSIYEAPLMYAQEKFDIRVLSHCGFDESNMPPVIDHRWLEMVNVILNPKGEINIALAGKYVSLQDAYRSINEALMHGGIAHQIRVNVKTVDTEHATVENMLSLFENIHGILVPGGFGERGVNGKLLSIQFARENNIPFLGICLGMQTAVIEFCRNVLGLEGAHSTEFYPETPHPVVSLLEEQRELGFMGASMRLGEYECRLLPDSQARRSYQVDMVKERHRHRYEINTHYAKMMEEKGLIMSGICPDNDLAEIVELRDHPWFVATQFHPEFISKPTRPHPLFRDFIAAAITYAAQTGHQPDGGLGEG